MSAKIAIYTVEDAQELWCPLTRVGEQASGAAENRPDGSYNCIGPGCMAWRWYETHVNSDGPGTDLVLSGEIYGYCGQFGSPRPLRGA